MESGEISDLQITASSVRSGEHLPGGARLNLPNNPPRRIWAAHASDPTAWLQVEFYQTANIIEVQTQYRFSPEKVYNYTLSYGDNGVDFTSYEQDDIIKVRFLFRSIAQSLSKYFYFHKMLSKGGCWIKPIKFFETLLIWVL